MVLAMSRTLSIVRGLSVLALTLAGACAPEGAPAMGDDRAAPTGGADDTGLEVGVDGARNRSCRSNYVPGRHPYPRGNEFPARHEGPFALARVLHVRVPSHDGVELAGTILLPALPRGVRAPVVLWSSPYLGTLDPPVDADGPWERPGVGVVVPVHELVARGYAVAGFNVRGTAQSGGCFNLFGRTEQLDQVALVEWLAAQPWSNGRVGMMGQSYDANTALEAAVHNPPALKTVVITGFVSDMYQGCATPQGAIYDDQILAQVPWATLLTTTPSRHSVEATLGSTVVHRDRICPDVARWVASDLNTTAGDVRDAAFYAERRMSDRFRDVRAAVLLAHGLQEHLAYSEDLAFRGMVNAPRLQLAGQWGHHMPRLADWNERLFAWFDFWLKGQGCPPEGLDTVSYEDNTGAWRQSADWPPAEAHDEVLYLRHDGLRPAPGGESTQLRAAPNRNYSTTTIDSRTMPNGPRPFCPVAGQPEPTEVMFETPVATAPVVLAGNPIAHLRLTSDQAGGVVSIQLFTLGPDFRCEDGVPSGYRFLTQADVDLRFYDGNMTARAFPVGRAVELRADFQNLAEVVPAGHRLVAIVSAGGQKVRAAQRFAPRITLGADGGARASHLVLPIVEGSFGGAAPTLAYPARPFAPPR